ncbi:MAG: DUF2335 domain-containing protein [Anaerohalosphaeraceae bacterium]|nr:DUF2335 domain-containing protein [Anaerohalosphaeraceae bacterium]
MPKNKNHLSQSDALSKQAVQQVVGIVEQHFSGPLPPPQVLSQYDEIIPNGAERIMVMAEKQGEHRRTLEKTALDTDSRNSLLGVIFAFVIGIVTVVTGAIVIIKGHSWPGTLLGSAGLIGLVSVFIYGTQQKRQERKSKADEN